MLLALAVSATLHSATASTFIVPKSTATFDGKIRSEEYKGAWVLAANQGTIRACYQGDDLFIGLSPKESGIASVLLLSGNTLTVLHASAALGCAKYQITKDKGKCIKKFDWQARPTPISGYKERLNEFWESEKWKANSIEDQSGQNKDREFQISLDLIQNQTTKIFFIYDSTTNSTVTFTFPQFHQLSSQWVELSRGNEVDLNQLDFSDWPVIELKQSS